MGYTGWYKAGLILKACSGCGAMVVDTAKHDEWHNAVKDMIAVLGESIDLATTIGMDALVSVEAIKGD